jgi:peptide deformylase
MSELPIETLGAPVLRQKADAVIEIDDELRLLIADMFDTMYAAEGIGLAGNQVGVPRRVIVVDVKDSGHGPLALVNPRIVERGREVEKGEEGCLSIPGVSALVERPLSVTVEGLDDQGHPIRLEAEGLLARCLLHEVDHLEGILFIDHLSALKRSMLVKKYRSLSEEEKGSTREKVHARRSE